MATGIRAARMRSAFVILQVALSLMLLVGAGLFLRTLKTPTRSISLPGGSDVARLPQSRGPGIFPGAGTSRPMNRFCPASTPFPA